MTWICSTATAAFCLASLGSTHSHAAATQSDLLAHYHFAGTDHWSSASSGAKLAEVVALPKSQALGRHLVDRLARAPQALFPQHLDGAQSTAEAELLRPLLADALRNESFLEIKRPATGTRSWLFGVALPPERASAWPPQLAELAKLWKLGTPTPIQRDGLTITKVRRDSEPVFVQWTAAGGWLLLGIGPESFSGWEHALAALRQSQRPRPPLTNGWLTAELDLPRLADNLGLSPSIIWPRASLSLSGGNENIRLAAQLDFPGPVTGPLDPWQVPTNIIREPLISFAAWRGARPVLERWTVFSRLGIDPVPNEVYSWAQSVNIPQTLFVFPATDPTNRVRAMLEPARTLIPAQWRESGLGQLEWQESTHEIIWRGLPLQSPHLRGVEDGGRGYILGGSFPPLPTTNAPPQSLLKQLHEKPNIVYYGWELTSQRLSQLRMQVQLSSMIVGKWIIPSTSPALPWLEEMEAHLGNAATEIVAASPREWSLSRRSPLGLTAAELIGLLCWAESLDFPRLHLRYPEQITPRTPPPGRKP